MHQAIYDMAEEAAFVTGVLARWHHPSSRLSVITCGHSPPLLQRVDGSLEELAGVPAFPFGIFDRERTFEATD